MIKNENEFTRLAYRIFGERAKRSLTKYYELGRDLQRAMINVPPEVYVATQMLFSVILAIVGLIIGIIAAIIVINFVEIPKFQISFPEPFLSYWLKYRKFFWASVLAALITIAMYFLGKFLFKIYPSFIISDRKSKINRLLPHAVMFMYSLSRGGMSILDIFKSIAAYEDVYSEVSKEFAKIVRDIEILSKDLRTALTEAIENTPSENLKDLLHGLITVIDSGGDITSYLEERAEFYLERARQEQKSFLDFLSLMAESYITAFVAGPLFLIIIQTVMAVMGQGDELMLYSIIYLIIPIGSFMFAMVIKLISPMESGAPPLIKERHRVNRNILPEVEKKVNSWKFRREYLNPIRLLKKYPEAILLFSVPAGMIFIILGFLNNPFYPSIDWFFKFDDYLFIALIIMLSPYAVFYEIKKRQLNTALKLTPVFLNKLASANESGMPIHKAIAMIAKTETSALKKEIEKIKLDLDWKISLEDALIRFANRIRVFELTRTITLLVEALRSTGNVTEVLRISAKDASNAELLRRERLGNMFMYVIIIYISFFVFIGIVYIISTTFLSVLAESTAKMPQGGFMGLASISEEFYRNVFMHAAVFQGLFAGLVAGVMGEGSFSSGVKHSVIMLTFGYVLFTLFI